VGILQRFGLADESGGDGVSCDKRGVALAGVPLLDQTESGLQPRNAEELSALIGSAYLNRTDVAHIQRGLQFVADALNKGELAKAMVGTLHLRLSPLDEDGVTRVRRASSLLSKYDPDEPRDWHGRWTTGGGDSRASSHSPPSTIADCGGPPGSGRSFGAHLVLAQLGGNGPPPEPQPAPEIVPEPDFPRVPVGWDTPAYTVNGIRYPATRRPKLQDGRDWPVADMDRIRSILKASPQNPSRMTVFVPLDRIGPILLGSTETEEYIEPEGYSTVHFIGTPQITHRGGSETEHAISSVGEALRMAATNEYSEIFFNRSMSLATGWVIRSPLRADVFGVIRPELREEFDYAPAEAVSPRQRPEDRQLQFSQFPRMKPIKFLPYTKLLRLLLKRAALRGHACS